MHVARNSAKKKRSAERKNLQKSVSALCAGTRSEEKGRPPTQKHGQYPLAKGKAEGGSPGLGEKPKGDVLAQ